MSTLFLVKLLAGGISVAVALLFLFFSYFFIRSEWYSRKLTKVRDLNKLKPQVGIIAPYLFFVVGFLVLGYHHVLVAFFIWVVWFLVRGRKSMSLFIGEPRKGSSLTRERMEELRGKHQNLVTNQRYIKYRNARNKRHRANFLNRLSKR